MESEPLFDNRDVDSVDENIGAAAAIAPSISGLSVPSGTVRQFCPDCGVSWQPQWACCKACTGRQSDASLGPISQEPSAIGASLALYFTLLGATAVGVIAGWAGARGADLLVGITAAHAVIVILWTLWGWRAVRPALAQPIQSKWIFIALLGAAVTYLLATVCIGALHRFAGIRELSLSGDLRAGGYNWAWVVTITCIVPAVFEELGFRGVILPSLQPTLTANEAIAVSALLFVTLHLSIPSAPHLLALGLALGYLRVKTGSLLPGMLLHFSHNFLCILSEHSWS